MGSNEINIGFLILGIEIKIVGFDGWEVFDGEVGELFVCGFNVMLGYYGQLDKIVEVIDCEGYLKIGDIVSWLLGGELVV